ncbi:MAG: FMN-binding protein [Clostridia bacterium]|nr:FMN-binding protein [Clostridia bacterium]
MRKLLSLMLVLVLTGSLFIGCAKKEEPVVETPVTETPVTEEPATEEPAVDGEYADGIYFATEDVFAEGSGWKGALTLEVVDGKITSVDWNAAHISAGKDKKTSSIDGDYGMVAYGKAQSEWHEQAALAESYLIENQTLAGINYTDAEGKTDTIAGVSVSVDDFEVLVNKALTTGPVGTGIYKDGTFYAEEADFNDSGWKDTVSFTVINGNIVAANWNGISKDGDKDKKTASIDGDYGMVAYGKASSEWHEQAIEVENFLLSTQEVDAIVADAVAGVSIGVDGFMGLAKEALELR